MHADIGLSLACQKGVRDRDGVRAKVLGFELGVVVVRFGVGEVDEH